MYIKSLKIERQKTISKKKKEKKKKRKKKKSTGERAPAEKAKRYGEGSRMRLKREIGKWTKKVDTHAKNDKPLDIMSTKTESHLCEVIVINQK